MILFIDEAPAPGNFVPRGIEVVTAAGIWDGVARLREFVSVRRLPAAVILGPGLPRPLEAARQVRHATADVHLVLLCAEGDEALRRALRFDPQVGGDWTVLANSDVAEISARVESLVRGAYQRRKLRATLDRMNERLGSRAGPSLQERLAAAEGQLTSILAHALDAMLSCDVEGRILSWNPAAELYFGLAESVALGRSLEELLPGAAPLLAQLRSGDGALSVEHQIHGRDLEVTLAPVRGADQGFLGISAVARDVTARRRAEAEIHQLNATLEQRVQERTRELEIANRELEAFSYSISHDLRAPLRHVAGFAELLRKRSGAVLDETSLGYLETIRNAAQGASVLIDELLRFSRSGKSPLASARVDMGALVREAIASLSLEMVGRTIDWRIEELPGARGDAPLLRQVWTNLLSNAVKYTRPRAVAQITVAAESRQRELVFSVRDNGVGFDPRYESKLFTVFQRLHAVGEFEGTGIGLAHVRRIVQRHGGSTWAESTPGQGAAFFFSLPRD